jgi:hypothetical protein
MSDGIISAIRTYVPIAVGAVVAFLAERYNILIDEETSMALVTALGGLLAILYWTLVRLAASKLPWFGVLLGYNVEPKYNDASPQTEYNALGNEA